MPPPIPTRLIGQWLVVVGFAGLVTLVLWLAGVSSPVLFGALIAGMVYALTGRGSLHVPKPVFGVGQALIGVTIGALVSLPTLRTLGGDAAAILGVTAATLVISVLAGQVLRLHEGVSATTGAFAMVAGGASGIVALAHELGADERVVTIVQYLRVLLVLLAMPVVTAVVFRPSSGHGGAVGAAGGASPWMDLAFTAVAVAVGMLAARYGRIPAGALLGPLVAAVVLSVTGVFGEVGVPALLQNVGFALIGVQVGLRFTRESLRSIARMLPLAVVLVLLVIAACAGLAVLLSVATGTSRFEAYLATTPGGLYAVLATAADSGSDVTFVLAVQVVRVFAMLLAAPLVARVLGSRR